MRRRKRRPWIHVRAATVSGFLASTRLADGRYYMTVEPTAEAARARVLTMIAEDEANGVADRWRKRMNS